MKTRFVFDEKNSIAIYTEDYGDDKKDVLLKCVENWSYKEPALFCFVEDINLLDKLDFLQHIKYINFVRYISLRNVRFADKMISGLPNLTKIEIGNRVDDVASLCDALCSPTCHVVDMTFNNCQRDVFLLPLRKTNLIAFTYKNYSKKMTLDHMLKFNQGLSQNPCLEELHVEVDERIVPPDWYRMFCPDFVTVCITKLKKLKKLVLLFQQPFVGGQLGDLLNHRKSLTSLTIGIPLDCNIIPNFNVLCALDTNTTLQELNFKKSGLFDEEYKVVYKSHT